MTRAFAYYRTSLSGPPITEQAATAEAFFQQRLSSRWGLLEPAFYDEAEAGTLALGSRPAGWRMCNQLRAGDTVIVSVGSLGFKNQRDLAERLRLWAEDQICPFVLDLGVFGDGPSFGVQLRLLEGLLATKGAWMREMGARRRAAGQLTGSPGYGFKTVGPAGKRRLVPDEDQRRIGRHILTWVEEAGHTFESIYWHLIRQKVRNRRNKEWSLSAIRRAYFGELKLQAAEQPPPQARDDLPAR